MVRIATLIAASFFVTLASVETAYCQQVRGSFAFGRSITTRISEKQIASSPAWKDTDESPPVAARTAMRVADKATKRIDEQFSYDRTSFHWKLRTCCLVPLGGRKWYWLVRYEARNPGVDIIGTPNRLDLVVLMNGKLVNPDIDDVTDKFDFGGSK